MKEYPIIFSTEMVRAILDGRKHMTRRVVKELPYKTWHPDEYGPLFNKKGVETGYGAYREDGSGVIRCPYGGPGDRLWVRETWAPYKSGIWTPNTGFTNEGIGYLYAAEPMSDDYGCRWKPSIHMPREAARILPTVKSVRVERLQEITEADAIAEGSWLKHCPCYKAPKDKFEQFFTQTGCYIHGKAFKPLWDGLHAKDGYGWDVNPWVWVIEFEREQP
jgi:hypothetical protein